MIHEKKKKKKKKNGCWGTVDVLPWRGSGEWLFELNGGMTVVAVGEVGLLRACRGEALGWFVGDIASAYFTGYKMPVREVLIPAALLGADVVEAGLALGDRANPGAALEAPVELFSRRG